MPQATHPLAYPSSTNFHPLATQFVISFSREVEDFPLNRYIQIVEAPAPAFLYHELDRDQAVRLRNLNDHVWADGADRPTGRDNQFAFREVPATTVRYDWYSTMGNQALKMHQQQWKAKQVYLKGLASEAMTGRTLNVVTMLDTVGNWPTTNVADVNTLNDGAGQWHLASDDPADVRYNAIKKGIMAAVTRVFLQTNSRVKFRDLRLLLHPEAATAMANTAEIHNYLKYSEATKQVSGDEENYNERWGLPKRLYGVEVVVEDSIIVSDLPTAGATSPGASTARAFIKGKTSAILLSRPGGLDGQAGPSFSTAQWWWYDSLLKTFEEEDIKNQKVRWDITDQGTPVLAAGAAGYLVQGIVPA